MIIDWLLNEVPQNKLQALEVYTFGNAANHFNNPYRDAVSSAVASKNGPADEQYNRAIRHIEHYANNEDFVACWGVLHFTKKMPKDRFQNRFMGLVFERPGKGHQLNQHYLDKMFPLDKSGYKVRETKEGDFMEMDCEAGHDDSQHAPREGPNQSLFATKTSDECEDIGAHILNESPTSAKKESAAWQANGAWVATNGQVNGVKKVLQVKDLSRLWTYRNGGSPPM
jgi:hypothetical protein